MNTQTNCKQNKRLTIVAMTIMLVLIAAATVLALHFATLPAKAVINEDYDVLVNTTPYTSLTGTLEYKYDGNVVAPTIGVSLHEDASAVTVTTRYFRAEDGMPDESEAIPAPKDVGEYCIRIDTVGEKSDIVGFVFFNITPRVLVADGWGGTFYEVYKSDNPTGIGKNDYLWALSTTGDNFVDGEQVQIAYRVKDGNTLVWPFNTACDAKTYKVEAYLDGDDAGNYILVDYIDEHDENNNKYTYSNFNLYPAKIDYAIKKGGTTVASDTYTYTGNAYDALTVEVTPYNADAGKVAASITSWTCSGSPIASEDVINVGAYSAPVITLTGNKAGNYYVDDPGDPGDDPVFYLTIAKADITGTITQDDWQYGMATNLNSKMHFTPSVVEGNEVGATLTWQFYNGEGWVNTVPLGNLMVPGDYSIHVIVSGNDNYNDTTIEGTATVTKARLYVDLVDEDDHGNLIYNGNARAAAVTYHLWTADGPAPTDEAGAFYVKQNLAEITANEGGTNVGNYSVTVEFLGGTYKYNSNQVYGLDGTTPLYYNDLFSFANSNTDSRTINYQIVPATLTSSMTVYGKVYDKDAFTAPVLKQFEYSADGETSFYKIYGFVNSENLAEFGNGTLTYTPTIKYAAVGNTANWEAVDENDWTSDAPVNAGEYYIWVVIDGIANYNKIEHHDSFTIQQKVVEYDWSNDDLTYTGVAQKPVATVTNNEAGDEVLITVTGEQTNYSAEAYTATATAVSNANYKLPDSGNTHNFTIGKAELTVTATSQNITYGDEAGDLEYTITGFVNSELEENVVTGAPVLTCAYKQYDDVKTYAITVAAGNLAADNYSFTLVNGVVTVGQKAATVTVHNVVAGYGAALALDVTDSGIFEADKADAYTVIVFGRNAETSVITGDLSATIASQDVGTYYIAVATNDANYAFTVNYVSGTEISIKKNPEAAAVNVEVCTYTINKVDATWNAPAAAESLVYNGNAQALIIAPTSVVGGTVQYFNGSSWSETMPTGTNAGTYEALRVKVVPDGNHNANLITDPFNVTIDRYTVTPTFTLDGNAFTADTNITYSNTSHTIAATATVNLTIAQEAVQKTITFDNATVSITNAGEVSLTIAIGVYAAQGDSSNNYKVTAATTSATLTIDKANYNMAGVTFADAHKTYNGTAQSLTVTGTLPTGLDDIQVTVQYTGSATNYTGTPVQITATFATTSDNYNVPAAMTADLTIDPLPVVPRLYVGTSTTDLSLYDGNDYSKTYDGTATYLAIKVTDTWYVITFQAAFSITDVEQSDSYVVKAGLYSPSANSDIKNFLVAEDVEFTYTINARDISGATITLGAALTFNGEEQTQAVTSVTINDLPVTYNVSNNTGTAATGYTLTVTGTGNFTGTATKAFNIAPKSIAGATVTLGAALTYNGEEQTQAVTSVVIDTLDATFDVSNNAGTNAGDYTLTVTGTGNFTGTATQGFTIAPKAITVTYTSQHKEVIYGATAAWEALLQEMLDNGYYLTADLATGDNILDVVSIAIQDSNSQEIDPGDETPVGKYNLVVGGNNQNYIVDAANLGAEAYLQVNPATLTNVSVAQSGTLTYNGNVQTATVDENATAVNNMAVSFTYSATQGGAYAATVPQYTNAGTYTVYFRATADNHTEATGSFPVTINRYDLYVNSANVVLTYTVKQGETTTAVYGATESITPVYNGTQYTVIVTGVVTFADQSTEDIAFTIVDYTYAAYDNAGYFKGNTGTNAGNYYFGFQPESNNFFIDTTSGKYSINWTIAKATLTVTMIEQDGTLTYTGAAQHLAVTTNVAAVNDQEITYLYSKTDGGEYVALDQITYTNVLDCGTLYYKLSAPNHNDATGSFTVTMNKVVLTITADNKAVIYGDATPAFTVSYNGFVGEEDEKVLAGELAFACDRVLTTNTGSYPITPSGLESGNYQIVFTAGMLTVNEAPLAMELTVGNITYGDTFVAPTIGNGIAVTGWKGTDTVALIKDGNIFIAYTVKGDKTFAEAFQELSTEAEALVEAGDMDAYEAFMTRIATAPTLAGTYYAFVEIEGIPNYVGCGNYTEYTIAKAASAIDLTNMVKSLAYTGEALTFTGATARNNEAALVYEGNVQTLVGTYTVKVKAPATTNYLEEEATVTVTVVEAAPVVDASGKTEYKKDVVTDASGNVKDADVTTIFKNAAADTSADAVLELKVGNNTIVFDKTAIAAIAAADSVKVSVDTKTGEAAAAEVKTAAAVFEITLEGATFADGKATVTLPFINEAPAGKAPKVYFVDENGKKVDMKGKFENDNVTFETNHFSTYAVMYKMKGGVVAVIIIAIVVVVAAACAAVYFFVFRKKGTPAPANDEPTADDAAAEDAAEETAEEDLEKKTEVTEAETEAETTEEVAAESAEEAAETAEETEQTTEETTEEK